MPSAALSVLTCHSLRVTGQGGTRQCPGATELGWPGQVWGLLGIPGERKELRADLGPRQAGWLVQGRGLGPGGILSWLSCPLTQFVSLPCGAGPGDHGDGGRMQCNIPQGKCVVRQWRAGPERPQLQSRTPEGEGQPSQGLGWPESGTVFLQAGPEPRQCQEVDGVEERGVPGAHWGPPMWLEGGGALGGRAGIGLVAWAKAALQGLAPEPMHCEKYGLEWPQHWGETDGKAGQEAGLWPGQGPGRTGTSGRCEGAEEQSHQDLAWIGMFRRLRHLEEGPGGAWLAAPPLPPLAPSARQDSWAPSGAAAPWPRRNKGGQGQQGGLSCLHVCKSPE